VTYLQLFMANRFGKSVCQFGTMQLHVFPLVFSNPHGDWGRVSHNGANSAHIVRLPHAPAPLV